MIQPLFIFSDWSILILRIILGLVLLAHGWPKIKNLSGNAQNFAGMGFKPARFWGTIAAVVEFFGGLFLIIGLLTQLVALLVAIQFVVAILKVKGKQGLVNGYELDLLILGAALLLVTVGGGFYSLDVFLNLFIY